MFADEDLKNIRTVLAQLGHAGVGRFVPAMLGEIEELRALLAPERLARVLRESSHLAYDEMLGNGSNPDYVGPNDIKELVKEILDPES